MVLYLVNRPYIEKERDRPYEGNKRATKSTISSPRVPGRRPPWRTARSGATPCTTQLGTERTAQGAGERRGGRWHGPGGTRFGRGLTVSHVQTRVCHSQASASPPDVSASVPEGPDRSKESVPAPRESRSGHKEHTQVRQDGTNTCKVSSWPTIGRWDSSIDQ